MRFGVRLAAPPAGSKTHGADRVIVSASFPPTLQAAQLLVVARPPDQPPNAALFDLEGLGVENSSEQAIGAQWDTGWTMVGDGRSGWRAARQLVVHLPSNKVAVTY